MNTITYSQRYLPHELLIRFHSVKLYRTGVGVNFVIGHYHTENLELPNGIPDILVHFIVFLKG